MDGATGVPELDVVPPFFSFADEDGTGRYEWARLGFAVSSGGALRICLGMFTTGALFSTSL